MFNRFTLSYDWFCMNLYQETPKEVTTIDAPIVLINLHYTRHNKATKVRVSPAPSVIITTSSVVTSLLPPHILTVTVTQGRMLTCSQNCNQWKTISSKTKTLKVDLFVVHFHWSRCWGIFFLLDMLLTTCGLGTGTHSSLLSMHLSLAPLECYHRLNTL